MKFWRVFMRNLLIMSLIAGAVVTFMAIFYPKGLSGFNGVGQVYSGLSL